MMVQEHMAQQSGRLSVAERSLLVLPTLVGLSIGLFPLLLPKMFAQVAQFPDDDVYVYQLTGAATLGYGVSFCWVCCAGTG